ncbi:MAG TPA: TetR/AcrR family transcriptional regulator [Actinocrinis sp.]|nr:TetR/AcrR family transcriptional regulator [Actinocrinis sp.]
MPKINAPSVAEHRERRRQSLLDAALAILVAEGAAAVTPAAIGARTNLARSSVYRYFSTSDQIIATVVEEAFPVWTGALAEAMARSIDPAAQVDAYVRETLVQAAAGVHRPMAALGAARLPEPCRARITELHRQAAAPLITALTGLGVAAPRLTAELIGGLLLAGMNAVEHGAALDEVTARTLDLVHHGLG